LNEIRLLVVPYELGRVRDGVGRGPERLLEFGAEDALSARGAAVRKEVLELEGDFSSEIEATFELIRMVSARVRGAVREGAFPVLLSGSCCFPGVGVPAGLDLESPGVLWFDAHGDFNSTESTDSGYFDGMGVTILTGGAWQTLLTTVEGARPLPETAVVLAGARDFDGGEQSRLESSDIAHLPPASIHSPESLLQALDDMRPSSTGLYVHVDLDVLDIEEARVNIYSVPDGVSAAELEQLVAAVVARSPVRALSLTAYDPTCDTDDAVPPIAMRILEVIADYVPRKAG
jgi:arginase